MEKDFSWTKSAEAYNKKYSDIFDGGSGEELLFGDAFENLKKQYIKIDKKMRKKAAGNIDPDYHLAVQFEITGRGAGVFYMEFTAEETKIEPYAYDNADARVSASYDNLMGMANGSVSAQKLFMNGQLKMTGNLSRGTELRNILGY